VLGSAVALKLLFAFPLLGRVLITALDVLIVLALQGRGFAVIEAFVVTLIASIAACFAYEIFSLIRFGAKRSASSLAPKFFATRILYIAIGILGATVMPTNLYLHSASLQTRASVFPHVTGGKPCVIAIFDSTLALASRSLSMPRFCSWRAAFTPVVFITSRKLPTPTNFLVPSRASLAARSLLARCLPRAETPR